MGEEITQIVSAHSKWSRWFGVLTLVLTLVVGLTVGALSNGRLSIVCGCLLVGIASAPLLERLRAEPLDGPGLYGLMTMLTFALTSLDWLGRPADSGPWLVRGDIGRPLVLVAAGTAAFTVGALVAGGARPARAPERYPSSAPSAPGAFAACYAITFALTAVGLAAGWYGFLAAAPDAHPPGLVGSGLPFVAQLSRVVILCLALEWLRTRDYRLRRLLIVFVVMQTIIGFIAGVKGESLYPVLLTALAFVAARQRLPWRLIAASAALLIFVLLPANLAYRQALRDQDTTSATSVARAVRDAGYRPDHAPSAFARYLLSRFRYIDQVALIMRDTPNVYSYGNTRPYMLLPLIAIVPRHFWPGKPTLDTAAQFAVSYWEIPPSARVSQPLTQVGDLFRTFGLVGVVVGLALWGLLVGAWTRLWRWRRSLRWDVVYIYALVVAVTYVESDLPILVATTVKALPPVAGVAWLLLPGRASPPGYQAVGRITTHQLQRLQVPGKLPQVRRP